jgi:hypothetical protein
MVKLRSIPPLTTLHHKQCHEHTQGCIETKVSKRQYVWTNTIEYRAISCENIVQTRRKLICLLPNLAVNFVCIITGCQAALLLQYITQVIMSYQLIHVFVRTLGSVLFVVLGTEQIY